MALFAPRRSSSPSRKRSRVPRYRFYLEELEPRQLLDSGTTGALAWVGLTPGWATFGQVLPMGSAYGLQIGDLPTQNDIKNVWDDGTIRFVIVSAWVPEAGDYPLWAADPEFGAFTPAVPNAQVRLTISGTQYTATLPTNFNTYDPWLVGPNVMEGRAIVTPVRAGGQGHPFLRVYFDFRGYNDGASRLDVTVENTLDQAGATAVTYNVNILVGGVSRFQRNNVQQGYLTRWRHVVNNLLPDRAAVTNDMEPVFQANALPRFLPIVVNAVLPPTGPTFDILGPGSLDPYMPNHGGRPELAPYPDWTARYLVHGDPVQKDYVLAHGDLAGSWPVHVRESDGRMVSIDERPNYWLDWRADPGDRPAGDLSATGPLVPDNAHQPSLAYVPYLVTGDRYYADELAMWANYVLLVTFQDLYNNARGGSLGFLQPNEVRGIGWGLRNLVDAAAYVPDDHPMKWYFVMKVLYNLYWLDYYALTYNNPLGVLWDRKRNENVSPGLNDRAWIAFWEQDYVAWAIDHANKQGFMGGLVHRNRIGLLHVSLFANDATRDGGAPYIAPVGTQSPPGSGNINYFTRLEQLYTGPTDLAGYYGPEARLVILIGLENGWPGAQVAYNYVHPRVAIDDYYLGYSDLALRAGWALSPDGYTLPEDGRAGQELAPTADDRGAASLALRAPDDASASAPVAPITAAPAVILPSLGLDGDLIAALLRARPTITPVLDVMGHDDGGETSPLSTELRWERRADFVEATPRVE